MRHPRDAVLWWWRAHNTINARLQTASDYAPQFPFDPAFPKSPWPPKSLCPQCWQLAPGVGSDPQNGTEVFDEHAVYHFMITVFYASEPDTGNHAVQVQQEWTALPLQSDLVTSPISWRLSMAWLASGVTAIAAAGVVAVMVLKPRASSFACASSELTATG